MRMLQMKWFLILYKKCILVGNSLKLFKNAVVLLFIE